MVIWVFYCRSFYTPLRRAGHSKTGRIMLAGTRLPAADDIFIWLLDTLLRMCCILPFKSSNLSHPINHAAGEDDTCHILLRSLLWAQRKTTLATPINPATAAVIPVVPSTLPFAPFSGGTIVVAVPTP